MKKIFVILTAFILGLSALVADEYQISSFKAFETAYGYEKEHIYIFINNFCI